MQGNTDTLKQSRTEVDRLFVCVVCGRAFSSKQGLRSHMRVHRGEYKVVSVVVNRREWEEFKEICRRHKTTTCAVLRALIQGVIRGERMGAQILNPNPIVIQVQNYYFGKPRSVYEVPLREVKSMEFGRWWCPYCDVGYEGWYRLENPPRCPKCGRAMVPVPGSRAYEPVTR